RQLSDDDQVTSVELRDEADRGLAEFIETEGDDTGIDDEHQRGNAHELGRQPPVVVGKLVEIAVEQAEEAADRGAPPVSVRDLPLWLEQQRAERRRQRQRHDQRYDGGAGNCKRELPVELAGDAGNKD